MKKILIIILSTFLTFNLIMPLEQAQAAVVSKAASQAAKKAAKELIKDAAINTTVNMTINFAMPPEKINNHKALESGYDAVCLPKTDGKKDPECKKPAQIKVPETKQEKKVLADKVEEVLDRKVGMNGWMKFLDWFVPVFLVGGAFTWLEAKLDKDSEDLFDQVANEAIEELGLIKPLPPKNPINVTDPEGKPIVIPPGKPVGGGESPVIDNTPQVFEYSFSNQSAGGKAITFTGNLPVSGSVIVIDIETSTMGSINLVDEVRVIADNLMYSRVVFNQDKIFNSLIYGKNGNSYKNYVSSDYFSRNSVVIPTSEFQSEVYKIPYNSSSFTPKTFGDVRRIIVEMPRADANGYGTSTYYIDGSGVISRLYASIPNLQPKISDLSRKLSLHLGLEDTFGREVAVRVMVFPSHVNISVPEFNPDMKIEGISPLDNSVFKNVNGTIKIIPGVAIPFIKPDGEVVHWNGQEWIDINGNPVPDVNEDELTATDPESTPDGFPIPGQKPLPEPEPNPEPKPPTDEDLEGLSCERLEKPDLKPLTTAFTTSFPFSIPWDIKRFIDNAFGGVGDDRPSFDLSFLADGVTIEIPEYFDSWIAFAKGLTIFVFDISILYLFYRFMKGGGD